MTLLIDTHCHLDAAEFDADRDAVAAAARQADVSIVVPAVQRANFDAVKACCRRYPCCVPAYGIHPMYVDHARPEDLQALRETLAAERPVAVGEIGLDFFVPGYDVAQQEFFFIEQLKIAREFDLPVLLHIRRAQNAILKHLRRFRVRGGIAHAFNGSHRQADEFLRLGFKLGFGGAMTFERARRIRELAATLPDEALVLETDAPDIPPSWLAPARNDPAQLPHIAVVLAGLRYLEPEAAAALATRNSVAVLPGLEALIDAGCRAGQPENDTALENRGP